MIFADCTAALVHTAVMRRKRHLVGTDIRGIDDSIRVLHGSSLRLKGYWFFTQKNNLYQ